MLSFQTITPNTLELLKQIFRQPELAHMRLVGGTALALQYGHRQSIDLGDLRSDFFTLWTLYTFLLLATCYYQKSLSQSQSQISPKFFLSQKDF